MTNLKYNILVGSFAYRSEHAIDCRCSLWIFASARLRPQREHVCSNRPSHCSQLHQDMQPLCVVACCSSPNMTAFGLSLCLLAAAHAVYVACMSDRRRLNRVDAHGSLWSLETQVVSLQMHVLWMFDNMCWLCCDPPCTRTRARRASRASVHRLACAQAVGAARRSVMLVLSHIKKVSCLVRKSRFWSFRQKKIACGALQILALRAARGHRGCGRASVFPISAKSVYVFRSITPCMHLA